MQMNSRDPKLVVLLFNECIANQNLEGLAALMSEGHTFIDRTGEISQPKAFMVQAWGKFFAAFPDYSNTFSRVESIGDTVSIVGHAFWSKEQPYDPVLWSARIDGGLVAEWRILEDTPENRKLLNLA
jgi:predicted SnoaL-like aldol condensation-catalyzing enzyme